MNNLRIIVALACLGALVTANPEYPLSGGQSETSLILSEIQSLKDSVESSTREHWESLQSLRFHLLSTRNGLQSALASIQSLKTEIRHQCSADSFFHNYHTTPSGRSSGGPRWIPGSLEPSASALWSRFRPTTPGYRPWRTTTHQPPTPRCQWPGDTVGGRCLVVVPDKLLTWDDAQEHCKKLNGKLAGEHSFDAIADHLNRQFGDYANPEVRWAMWAGATQTLEGWEWANNCKGEEVDEDKWAEHQPHQSSAVTHARHCMSLDGFKRYRGVAAPCTALRRFVCDVAMDAGSP